MNDKEYLIGKIVMLVIGEIAGLIVGDNILSLLIETMAKSLARITFSAGIRLW